MSVHSHLAGVYVAAVTPLRPDDSIDLEAIDGLLEFYSKRGCHGALLLGTTGEGPSFDAQERLAIFKTAQEARKRLPAFRLLAGTGTPSLTETISLTRAAFEAGLDGVVVLPPYYYRNAPEDGLFVWFSEVLRAAVPAGGSLLAYHIPPISGVHISLDLLARLKEAFPDRFAGLKDSSGEPEFAQRLGERFGSDLVVLTGNDRLFSLALQAGASGAITALANLLSPYLRKIWDAPWGSDQQRQIQECLTSARSVMDRYPPAPSTLKALLAHRHGFPQWTVRPPLLPIRPEVTEMVAAELIFE
jgi:4-hydroxy-tetrahydrodipicolinate synthase